MIREAQPSQIFMLQKTIIDFYGDVQPYVNVWVKGRMDETGVTADANGNFTMYSLNVNDVLVFSKTGMRHEYTVSEVVKDDWLIDPFIFEQDPIVIVAPPKKKSYLTLILLAATAGLIGYNYYRNK